MSKDEQNDLKRVPTNPHNEDGIPEHQHPQPPGNLWAKLDWLQKRGLYKGEIDTIETKQYSLTRGPHYYVVDDRARKSIVCISCEITHGGILEAHLLERYRVENGVLYFDEKPTNKTPDGFVPPD